MKAEQAIRKSLGITARTALLSWLVTTATLLLFIVVLIPMQKQAYLENLESRAKGLVVSLNEVNSGALMNGDFSAVVEHCNKVLNGAPSLSYIIMTKNDGFSIVFDRGTNWWYDSKAGAEWRPLNRVVSYGIGTVPLFHRRVFFYSQPFNYSAVPWGWVHVGLSLDSYDRYVSAVCLRTGILAVICVGASLLASLVYAKRLVQPILRLRQVVGRVASGDLTVRAEIQSGNELDSLASSVNSMTESLHRRDLILESMRFAAEKFLSSARWETVVDQVLAKIGEADDASRVAVLQKETLAGGPTKLRQICQWESPTCPPTAPGAAQHTLVVLDTNLEAFLPLFENGISCTKLPASAPESVRQAIALRQLKAFICIPIMVDGSWWGVFSLVECRQAREWTDNEKDSFRAVAEMFGAAIERELTQNALIKAKETAESASRAKSQFLANMSHEIRTPITGVIGMLQLLQRTELDKRQSRFAGNALTSAKTLLSVIGDVLDFAKIEAGKMELDEHVFDPAEVVDTVMRLFAEAAEAKGLELAYRVSPEVPRQLQGDSNRLRQILVNLVGNAVKFTTHGEVVVTCQTVNVPDHVTRLRFEVRDTGCGVEPEKQKLIFDAFSQADNSMARRFGGTGLGLTISRQFCELMGGSIDLQSAVGAGSTFCFTIPFRDVPGGEGGATGLRDLRQMRILVVDDCAATRKINRRWISAWQAVPEEAVDAGEALEKLEQSVQAGSPFQVAVVDWKMPGVDGLTLARLIKDNPRFASVGLVLLSSFTPRTSFEKITAAGFAAFVPKPAGKSDLYDAIMTAANRDFKKPVVVRREPVATAPVPARGSAGTVLLTEDNEINREVATEILTALGYQVRWVSNGRDAVEAWSRGGVDVVLMDCQMPEMDGYEAVRAIRQEEGRRADGCRVPVIALTAHAGKSDRDDCLAAGMDDYLSKPLDPPVFEAMLAKWMPKQTPPAGAAQADGGLPPVNYASLLQRCLNKAELATRLLGKFVQQAEQDVAAIGTAVQHNDLVALAAVAHRLKGASANVAAEPLRLLATTLEGCGRRGNVAVARPLLPQLQLELLRLKQLPEPALGDAAATFDQRKT